MVTAVSRALMAASVASRDKDMARCDVREEQFDAPLRFVALVLRLGTIDEPHTFLVDRVFGPGLNG